MSDIETRLGRIEGSLDIHTRTLMLVLDRMEKRLTLIEESIVTLRVYNGKRTGMITMFSASLSAVVAVVITLFNKGS